MFLVCGEALFDFFVDQPASADSWPQLRYQAVPGGSPFNVAIGLARLGQRAALFSGVSQDFLGRQLLSVLQQEDVDCRYLQLRNLPTTLALVGLDAAGKPQYSFYGSKAPEASLSLADLPPLDAAVQGIHVGSYALVSHPTGDSLQQLVARESQQRLISLDPNIRLNVEPDLNRWRSVLDFHANHAHLIKVSDEDLQQLYPDLPLEEAARRWLGGQCSLLILTRGGEGVTVFSPQHGEWSLPAQPVDVVDSVGAGDTFQAALLCYLAEQGLASPAALARLSRDQIDHLLQFAIRAAAITCSRRGPDLPRRAELLPA